MCSSLQVLLLLNTRQSFLERDAASTSASDEGQLLARHRHQRSLSCKGRVGWSPPRSPAAGSPHTSPLHCVSIRLSALSMPTTPKAYGVRRSQSTRVRVKPSGCALCGDRWCFDLECCPLVPPPVRPMVRVPYMTRPQLYDQILLHGWSPGDDSAASRRGRTGRPHPHASHHISRVDSSGRGGHALGPGGALVTEDEASQLGLRKKQAMVDALAAAGRDADPSLVRKVTASFRAEGLLRPASALPCRTGGGQQGAPIPGIMSGRGTRALRDGPCSSVGGAEQDQRGSTGGPDTQWSQVGRAGAAGAESEDAVEQSKQALAPSQSAPVSRPSSALARLISGQAADLGSPDSLHRMTLKALMRRTAPSTPTDPGPSDTLGSGREAAPSPPTSSAAAASEGKAVLAGAAASSGAAQTAGLSPSPSRPSSSCRHPLQPKQHVEIVHSKPKAVAMPQGGLSVRAVAQQDMGASTRDRYFR